MCGFVPLGSSTNKCCGCHTRTSLPRISSLTCTDISWGLVGGRRWQHRCRRRARTSCASRTCQMCWPCARCCRRGRGSSRTPSQAALRPSRPSWTQQVRPPLFPPQYRHLTPSSPTTASQNMEIPCCWPNASVRIHAGAGCNEAEITACNCCNLIFFLVLAGAALPMPGLEELLDAQVFKNNAHGLYYSS